MTGFSLCGPKNSEEGRVDQAYVSRFMNLRVNSFPRWVSFCLSDFDLRQARGRHTRRETPTLSWIEDSPCMFPKTTRRVGRETGRALRKDETHKKKKGHLCAQVGGVCRARCAGEREGLGLCARERLCAHAASATESGLRLRALGDPETAPFATIPKELFQAWSLKESWRRPYS